MIWTSFEKCFPLIKERSSTRDPPFMSLKIYLLKLRKRAIQKRNMEAKLRLQERINKLIQENKLYAVNKKWDKKMVVHCE